MSAQSPVPSDHPLMIAWTKLQESGEYVNARGQITQCIGSVDSLLGYTQITLKYPNVEGALWFAFCEGWKAAGGKRPFED